MKQLFLVFVLLANFQSKAQYTLEDSLAGSNGPQRTWWNVTHYDLKVKVDIENQLFSGENEMSFEVLQAENLLQIDLQPPMKIEQVLWRNQSLTWQKKGKNAWMVQFPETLQKGNFEKLNIKFSGKPTVAQRPPWDGGSVWSKDSKGRPFVATANQGIGASIWWPCKDHPSDEPENGAKISVTVPKGLMDVSNGRLISEIQNPDNTTTFIWQVINPINNYGINLNIAHYSFWKDVYQGEKGPLDVSFYALPENLEKAKVQFKDAYRMLEAFEHWFGPYPFYEDGYKLVEAPYLGMEHQSSVTYGNGFQNGYKGRDLSQTGWGLKWDFIIVHESGHEWFANNITYKDKSDMWIHESFTNYSENLFTEYFYGKEAGAAYVKGTRALIRNDEPIIPTFGMNQTGSGDMYYKGGNMLHTIRQIVNNDEAWRQLLRGLNVDFYHQTVSTEQVVAYFEHKTGLSLSKVFDQYLRTTQIPKFVVKTKGKKILYHWENVIQGFDMPLDVMTDKGEKRLFPTEKWKKIKTKSLIPDDDYFIVQ